MVFLAVTFRNYYAVTSQVVLAVFCLSCLPADVLAEVTAHANVDFAANPVNLVQGANVPPQVMINLSNDHQLFFKAFDDFSDLDGDGVPETTYKHSVDYYGYFDSYKCYEYDISDERFEPRAETSDKYCTGTNDGYWSGNFLNWAAMARIDAVRKLLYGGHRRVDTTTETVLERAHLPTDTHSWVKYYEGADLQSLTPFVRGVDYDCDQGDITAACAADERLMGITIGNTTDFTSSSEALSQDVTDPPLIKVVKGNYSLWAASERWQVTWRPGGTESSPNVEQNGANGNVPANSGINAYANSPYWDDRVGEGNYIARVQACVPGLVGKEKCKQYPAGNLKPIGLLQVYGDNDQMLFGMIAGSYKKHTNGGVLIRNMTSLADEVNINTDGTFPMVAQFAGGPSTNNTADGMINALSLFRIIDYRTTDGLHDNCGWDLRTFADLTAPNQCRSWGNPFSEIYYQAINYFSKGGVIGIYNDNNSANIIPGLPQPQAYSDPLNAASWCAPLFVVNFNSSTTSFDADEVDPSGNEVYKIWDPADLPNGTSTTSADLTDVIGAGEGLHGNDFFFGYTDVDNSTGDGVCTAKSMASFGDIGGVCPEGGRLWGSYRIAGLAYYAHIADLRPDSDNSRDLPGMQNVDTYALAMATSTPTIEIMHPTNPSSKAVTLIPACRDQRDTPHGNCSLAGFKIVSQNSDAATGIGTGKLFVSWEVGSAGGDYDQDMWGTIEYTINDNTNTFSVTTQVFAQSSGGHMALAYILEGTTDDGFHAHSGINGFDWTDTSDIGSDCSDADGCYLGDGASTKTYTLGTSSASQLKDPLWYASKWGAFVDSNSNNIPDLVSEWDREINATGQDGSDGIPDSYFYASNPNELEASLSRVFNEILQRVSSGTAAAVVSNNVRGEGLLYQAFYEPAALDDEGAEATWIGNVRALWLDRYGFLREDDNGNRQMDDYQTDLVIESYYDDIEARTRVRRWSSSDPETFIPNTNTIVELDEVAAVWSADLPLSNLIANGVSITSQRLYASTFQNNGRYIFTWMDDDGDDAVGVGETKDFVASTFSADYGYLNVADAGVAANVANYIRGLEQSGLRNRTIDHDNDNATAEISLILGDIINSTPTVVGAPQESLNLLYKDSSYAEFLVQYKNRRTVVYAGANDGMLHAFNGGFVSSNNQVSLNGQTISGAAATPHELGAELWAYVPQNLLPHLKWLTSGDYQHVFYVDGKPRVADVKIFPDDATHPNGWGTVLVVGMRLGGIPISVDTAADGLAGNDGDGDTSDDRTFSSAYSIFDITNPEDPPVLLAEISLPDNSLTTVYPTFFKEKDIDPASDPNQWFLIFGSGPDNHVSAESSSTAKVYVLNLLELTMPISSILNATTVKFGDLDGVQDCTIDTSTGYTLLACDTGKPNSFMGDPVAVDWQLDYRDDAIYFGTVGDENSTSGTLYRFALDGREDSAHWREPFPLFDAGLPISAGPTVSVDDQGKHWVFFGTGRLWSQGDLAATESQALFGMKDAYDPAETSTYGVGSQLDGLDLYDATNINIINFMRGDVTVFDGSDDTTTMRVTWLQGNVGAGPYQDWQVDNFTSGGSGISNTANTLGAVNTLRSFQVEPPSVANVVGDDILTWTTGGEIINGPGSMTTFNQLEAAIDSDSWAGWVVDLVPIHGTVGVDPATRATTQSSLVGGTLFTSVYQPSTEPCDAEGFSRLYGLYYKTGTAHPRRMVFGLQYDLVNNAFTETSVDLGRGFATAPAVHSGSGAGSTSVSVFTQLSTGTIERDEAELVDSVRSGWISWRSR